MPEIGTSDLMRAGAARKLAPPLLDAYRRSSAARTAEPLKSVITQLKVFEPVKDQVATGAVVDTLCIKNFGKEKVRRSFSREKPPLD
jgi:hypothetical protein